MEKTREMSASQLKRHVGHDKTMISRRQANKTENVFIAISSDQGLKNFIVVVLVL